MRRMGALVGILLCVLSLAAQAGSVRLCDYVSPETDLADLGLSFSYRYFNDGATEGLEESGGRVAVNYDQIHDSPNVGFTLAASGELLLTGLEPSGGLGEGSGTFRYYLTKDQPLFGFGGLEASFATGLPAPAASLRVGIGYGRFSDVTPLAKAFAIQDELLQAGSIRGVLPGETLLKIAELIGQRATYDSVEDLAAAAVAMIQTASEMVIAPRQVLMVEDVIAATGDERNCGWAVQAGLGYELIDPYGGARNLLLTASADLALAPDAASQLLCRASFSGPFNILEENTLTARASYARTLSETSSMTATYTLQRMQPLGLAASTSHALAAVLGFVVGEADVGLQISLTKAADVQEWTVDVTLSASLDLL
ncbi:MAG: hypothetical protein AB1778_10270 [Candidatus Bipolaricaulota bacterium]